MLFEDKSMLIDVTDVKLNIPEGMLAILLLFNITLMKELMKLEEKLNPVKDEMFAI